MSTFSIVNESLVSVYSRKRIEEHNRMEAGNTSVFGGWRHLSFRFIARLFLSIDCVEFMGESAAHRMHLDHSPIMEAESISVSYQN